MKIYRQGIQIADVFLRDNSYQYEQIGGDNLVTLVFDVLNPLELEINDYVTIDGNEFSIRHKESVKKVETSLGFSYTAVFYHEQYKLRDVAFFMFGKRERKRNFDTYTGTALQVLELVVSCMNREFAGWAAGACPVTEMKTYSLRDMQCSEVIDLVCSENKMEYWVTGKAIHLGNRQFPNNGLTFGQGYEQGFKDLELLSVSEQPPVTVIYPYGSDKNLGGDYGADFLLLPGGQEELTKNTDKYGRFSKAVSFPDIFPKGEFHVTGKIDNFTLQASDMDFNLAECLLDGVEVIVTFQTGALAGYDLAIVDKSWQDDLKQFKLKLNEQENALKVPGDINFKVGDMFILTGLKMPQSYIDNAEQRLEDAARAWLDENADKRVQLRAKCDDIYFKKHGIQVAPGQMVRVFSQKLGIDREIRVTAVKRALETDPSYNLIQPYRYEITLSDFLSSNGFKGIINEVKNMEGKINSRVRPVYDFTKRSYRDAKETQQNMFDVISNYFSEGITPITVETMHALVGNPMLQFIFLDDRDSDMEIDPGINYVSAENRIVVLSGAWLKHMTLGIDYMGGQPTKEEYRYWYVPAFESQVIPQEENDRVYYLYVRASRTDEAAEYVLADEKRTVEHEEGYYHFWVGILNSKYDNSRSLALMYGFFEITPGQMTGRRFQSTDGFQFWDFVLKSFQIGDASTYLKYNGETGEMAIRGSIIQDEAGDPVAVFKGEWNADTYYKLGNEVKYNGVTYTYVSSVSTKGNLPTNTSYWISRKGETGATGPAGAPGADGTNGRTLSLSASAMAFKYAAGITGSPTPSSIVLACSTNVPNPYYNWYMSADGSVWQSLQSGYGAGSYTVLPTLDLLVQNNAVTFRCVVNDLSDQVTIVRLADGKEGKDAYTVVLDNETHGVACDVNGTPLAGEIGQSGKAVTRIKAYRGTTQLQPLPGNGINVPPGYYSVRMTDTQGVSFDYLPDGSGVYIVSYPGVRDSARVGLNVWCEDGGVFIKKEFTLTKVLPGKDGQEGDDGMPGATMVFRGEYNVVDGAAVSVQYYGTAARRDVVRYNSRYYIAKMTAGAFNEILPTNTAYWDDFGAQFSSIATGLLFAETALIAGWNFNNEMIWSQNDNMGLDGRPGQGVRFWAGIDRANRANAPFRIYEDGTFVATGATITGKFQSNANGNRVLIDPNDERKIQLLDTNSNRAGTFGFFEENGYTHSRLDLYNTNAAGNVLSQFTLAPYFIRMLENATGGQVYFGNQGGGLFMVLDNLPTNPSLLGSGRVWRDGTTLRIVP